MLIQLVILVEDFYRFFLLQLLHELIMVQVEVRDYSIDFITNMLLLSATCLFVVSKESA